ncbi:MAG: hypothetical protein M3R45_05930 [Pseudomonadota bacterium]|nr:hypothetical protein [Pseudomonadota bacterium]
MLANEKISIAAHLHVLLRRKTGRVTDTEWMATNRDYALEMVRFARQKAAEDGHADLALWATRLAEAMAIPVVVAASALRAAPAKAHPESGFGDSLMDKEFGDSVAVQERRSSRDAPRYVKGLR